MNTQADINKEILEARKKFSEMYPSMKLGGKGKTILSQFKELKKERRW